jgi:hypothetical protein
MSTEVNKMSNNKPEKKDKITIEIDHKLLTFLATMLATAPSRSIIFSFNVFSVDGACSIILTTSDFIKKDIKVNMLRWRDTLVNVSKAEFMAKQVKEINIRLNIYLWYFLANFLGDYASNSTLEVYNIFL